MIFTDFLAIIALIVIVLSIYNHLMMSPKEKKRWNRIYGIKKDQRYLIN